MAAIVAIDTCVVVRLLTKDDLEQYQTSYQLIEENQIFVSDTVVLETHWVLKAAYSYTKEQICQDLRWLCGLDQIHLENSLAVAEAINWYESGLDFADALHLAKSQQHSVLYTFDKEFVKRGRDKGTCRLKQL